MKHPGRLSVLIRFILITSCIAAHGLHANEPDGRRLYEENCASCHGVHFKGTGLGPALSPATYIYGGQEWDVYRIAKNGLASKRLTAIAERKL